MDAERITSVKNPTVRMLRSLQTKPGREENALVLIEGATMIAEALSCRLMPGIALYNEEKRADFAPLLERLFAAGAQLHPVAAHVLNAASDTVSPQGIACAFGMPAPLDLDASPQLLIALDGVQDPGNVGTIWRTADAAGFQGLLIGEGGADPFSPKVLRAAMGSGFRVPVCTGSLSRMLDALPAHEIVVSTLDGAPFFARAPLAERLVLVIGNEAHGVRQEILERADVALKLPMPGGAESLNAAVAAGIMMYDIIRSRAVANP